MVPGLIALAVLSGDAAADFAPGSRRPRPPGPGRHPGQQVPHRPTGVPPDTKGQIPRFVAIVLAQPGAVFPLQRLAQLYRERDGNLEKALAEFSARSNVTGDDQYAVTLALAGLHRLDGDIEKARAAFERAIAQKPNDPAGHLALARALHDRGDLASARGAYERALEKQTVAVDREQTLRTLMTIVLDLKDFTAAKTFHDTLVKLQPQNLFLKAELGRELYNRNEFERASVELEGLVAAAAGDNRALAPALKDWGRSLAKAGKRDKALGALKRGLSVAGADAAVRTEIFETIAEIYRASQQLAELIQLLESEHPSDFARLALLGGLYDETGDADRAIATYRRALGVNPRHTDLHVRMVRLLQAAGKLDDAIREYEGLIRASKSNPTFVFELCEVLLQRGEREKALRELSSLESRLGNDEDNLARLADFYGKIEETDRSLRILQRLAQMSNNDPAHLVDLGDRYFQDGKKDLAVQTWKRILTAITPRALALAALGEVYVEHDMGREGVAALREAVSLDPKSLAYKKQLAAALEHSKGYAEARILYLELISIARDKQDRLLAREARSRLVLLWSLEHLLEAQIQPLMTLFAATPPDVEAGRTLGEVFNYLKRPSEAENILRKLTELVPGDADALLGLERVYSQTGKLEQAILVLEKLVKLDPKLARDSYQRMAQYATKLFREDDAIRYAAKAVELNPEDAEGHRRLGDMYRARRDDEKAIFSYRAALSKNARLFPVYFQLADLFLIKGHVDDADRLFRQVVRSSPDEDFVARAARASMQIHMGSGTLETLEQDLLPLTIANPRKLLYRKLLLDIYGSLTFELVQRARFGSPADAIEARRTLAGIGARAIKPLLDALLDNEGGQQRTAIEALGFVSNRNAAIPLFTYATGNADQALRVKAMASAATLASPDLLPRLEGLFAGKIDVKHEGATRAILPAAAWAVARSNDRRALPLLAKLQSHESAEVRAIATIGLSLLGDEKAVSTMGDLALDPSAEKNVRVAALLGFAARSPSKLGKLAGRIFQQQDPLVRSLYLGLYAQAEPAARTTLLQPLLADFVFGEREASARALYEVLRGDSTATPLLPKLRAAVMASLELHSVTDLTKLALPTALSTREAIPRLLETHQVAFARACAEGLETRNPEATLSLLDEASHMQEDTAFQSRLGETLASLPNLAKYAETGSATTRAATYRLLTRATASPASAAALVKGLAVRSEAAPILIESMPSPMPQVAEGPLEQLLASDPRWEIRRLAALALAKHAGTRREELSQTLARAAKEDPFAIVRDAALQTLETLDHQEARKLATLLATTDPEPMVRERATAILEKP